MRARGSLAIVLHAHLPYVRHPEHEDFLEEDWLFEAITETYVPLLRVLRAQVAEGHRPRLCMSLTPPLCNMLKDELLQQRYLRYLTRLIALAQSEVERLRGEDSLRLVAAMYLERFIETRRLYEEEWKRDVVGQFARLQEEGVLEIITCGATHGFLPLLAESPEAVRAQIFLACDDYRRHFGRDPRGIWLPECAYVPGLDLVLREAGLRWFILDSHGLMFGTPRPRYAIYQPVFTPHGPAAFARDRESSKQVWSAEEGYPGDPAYRDFYRDIGFDLSQKYLAQFLPPDSPRRFTGMKYHRITGRASSHKEVYNRAWAEAAVDAHATHFMQSRAAQIAGLAGSMPAPPIVVSPFDAELFGHWWFEGPEFLDLFLRKALYDQDVFDLVSPGDHLDRHPTHQCVQPSASSWGNRGYWEVWLDDSNSWIYPHLHAAAARMTALANKHRDTTEPLIERVLAQLARELLLAQSSDWAFLMRTGTARQYAERRSRDHILRFNKLHDQAVKGRIDEAFLLDLERRDNIFPQLDWRHFCSTAIQPGGAHSK